MSLTSSIPVLRVSHDPRARAFWTDVLGFELAGEAGDLAPGFGILKSGRATVFLNAWDGPEAAYTHWRAYFHTTDLRGMANRIESAGAPFKGPTRTQYAMDELEVADPDGNVVCFGQDAA